MCVEDLGLYGHVLGCVYLCHVNVCVGVNECVCLCL